MFPQRVPSVADISLLLQHSLKYTDLEAMSKAVFPCHPTTLCPVHELCKADMDTWAAIVDKVRSQLSTCQTSMFDDLKKDKGIMAMFHAFHAVYSVLPGVTPVDSDAQSPSSDPCAQSLTVTHDNARSDLAYMLRAFE